MFREMSFISYYYHWQNEEVMKLEHSMRRRWCEEISAIHKSLNLSKKKEKNIFELKADR